ncbi:hypothetical protein [Alistipes sp.]|uniref:hypothetical protein n=1 Tax=Alistipes sp. TaxID=1872444 RepID=UPI003AF062CE
MTAEQSIDRVALKAFLAEAERLAHPIYTLLSGLPKANFHLLRFYEGDRAPKIWEYDEERNRFTVAEFLTHYDDFHPHDSFGICFAVHLDRIDSNRADDYADCLCIDMQEGATVRMLEEYLDRFLENYCERCMRDNRPFELTEQTIAAYGFTAEDVAMLQPRVERFNEVLRRRIRAEYEALAQLDFIRAETAV